MTVPHITIEQAKAFCGENDAVRIAAIFNQGIDAVNANAEQEQYITAEEARKLGAGKAEWSWMSSSECTENSFAGDEAVLSFVSGGTYTYRTKGTIMLDGNMVTPEQAAAEWEAKRETHDVWASFRGGDYLEVNYDGFLSADYPAAYELRLKPDKQPTWTGSRENVLALLKEVGVL